MLLRSYLSMGALRRQLQNSYNQVVLASLSPNPTEGHAGDVLEVSLLNYVLLGLEIANILRHDCINLNG